MPLLATSYSLCYLLPTHPPRSPTVPTASRHVLATLVRDPPQRKLELHVSPLLYLPYISPISRLYLAYISAAAQAGADGRRPDGDRAERDAAGGAPRSGAPLFTLVNRYS